MLDFITEMYVPVIIAAGLVIGYLWKNFLPNDNKYIPVILTIVGAILGCALNGTSVEAIIAGGVSGLASIGLHQLFKQLIENGSTSATTATDAEIASGMENEEITVSEDVTDEEEIRG